MTISFILSLAKAMETELASSGILAFSSGQSMDHVWAPWIRAGPKAENAVSRETSDR